MKKEESLLKVENLSVDFGTGSKKIRAINKVTFRVQQGEILGIVGESGSGKSVSSLAVMRLIAPPGHITEGSICFQGENLIDKTEDEMTAIRGNKISMIFQEPMTSFNPVYTVGSQIIETIMRHQNKNRWEAEELAIDLMKEVGISNAERRIKEYPHQMSGGMLQRCMIAMALSCNPELLIADEPTTALDVTTQAQIIDLLKKLQKERGMSIMMITHDLGVIAEMAKYVIVMYRGRIVEESKVEKIYNDPLHPYTEGLLKSIPKSGQETRLYMIPQCNEIVTKGCRFYPRCPNCFDKCREEEPDLFTIADGRKVKCWIYEQDNIQTEKERGERSNGR